MPSDGMVTQALKAARAMLPADPAELLPWLLVQPMDTLIRLLTLCAALSVNAIGKGKNMGAEVIAEALKLDMADWWAPTADSYLNAVPKVQIVQAVAEAGMPQDARGLAKLKKAEAVAKAQVLLAGKRWVPTVLR